MLPLRLDNLWVKRYMKIDSRDRLSNGKPVSARAMVYHPPGSFEAPGRVTVNKVGYSLMNQETGKLGYHSPCVQVGTLRMRFLTMVC